MAIPTAPSARRGAADGVAAEGIVVQDEGDAIAVGRSPVAELEIEGDDEGLRDIDALAGHDAAVLLRQVGRDGVFVQGRVIGGIAVDDEARRSRQVGAVGMQRGAALQRAVQLVDADLREFAGGVRRCRRVKPK